MLYPRSLLLNNGGLSDIEIGNDSCYQVNWNVLNFSLRMLVFKASRFGGLLAWILSIRYSQRKKSGRLRSGEKGGQRKSVPRMMSLSLKKYRPRYSNVFLGVHHPVGKLQCPNWLSVSSLALKWICFSWVPSINQCPLLLVSHSHLQKSMDLLSLAALWHTIQSPFSG